ncbi:hypothetical protein HYALB_00010470 [Hymenoscyphus albidus]|uniref:2EXR domain-containing protein n=1 Tax=Hymenoscyphus albidus TaxID=595503 RepID=A0A9N9LSH8_9HELO|nr:hypothetical protein HYALB_00010470 [Hymenoscyphus albidus]
MFRMFPKLYPELRPMIWEDAISDPSMSVVAFKQNHGHEPTSTIHPTPGAATILMMDSLFNIAHVCKEAEPDPSSQQDLGSFSPNFRVSRLFAEASIGKAM